jgi:hypothetical protein
VSRLSLVSVKNSRMRSSISVAFQFRGRSGGHHRSNQAGGFRTGPPRKRHPCNDKRRRVTELCSDR